MSPSPESLFYLALVKSLHSIAERLEQHMTAIERGDIPKEKRKNLLQFVEVTLQTVADALKCESN